MIDIDPLTNRLKKHERNILGHEQAVKSAVLVPLLYQEGEWQVLFEVRAHDLNRQPGEICFPGGRLEAQDANSKDTAVRETCEELLITEDQIELLGALDILVQPQSLFVYPYVGIIRENTAIVPNREVDEIFTVPLNWLLDNKPEKHHLEMQIRPEQNFPFELIPNGKDYNWRQRSHPEYFYRYQEHIIWGLTARILQHFLTFI